MHLRNGAGRNFVLALALVALSLPLAGTPSATPAHAQISPPTSSATGAGFISPALAINVLGTEHTETFTCTNVAPAAGGALTAVAGSGCYFVTGSVQNATEGTAVSITRGTCSGVPNIPTGSTMNCGLIPGAPAATATAVNTATITINPGAPDTYTKTFSGYVPALCPATAPATVVGGVTMCVSTTSFVAPTSATCATGTATLTGLIATCGATPPTAGTCTGTGTFTVTGVIGSCSSGTVASATCTAGTAVPVPGVAPTGSTVTCGAAAPTATVCPAGSVPTTTAPFLGGAASSCATTVAAVCPTGTGTGATATTGGAATPGALGGGLPGCAFTVVGQKKYVQITALTPSGTCGGSLIWSEALKSFLGPSCAITFAASGTVNIKFVPDCTAELAALNSGTSMTLLQAEFGAGAHYVCTGNVLGVAGISSTSLAGLAAAPASVTCSGGGTATVTGTVATCPTGQFVTAATCANPNLTPTPTPNGTSASVSCTVPNNLAGLPLTLTSTGFGASTGVTLGSFCVGGAAPTTGTAGTAIVLCPTGPGAASITACVTSTINTQPPGICSTVTGNFTLPVAGRVVPYVRWAGEKIVLTKCFGGAGLMAGALVEFTLKGNNPGLNATLIPTAAGPAGSTTPAVGGTGAFATADTVYAVTDARGCASVIGYADGEGVMYVDAALFSTAAGVGAAGTTPIINEHAFEVFYLKFESVSLENITATGSTYSGANALGSPGTGGTGDLSFLAGAPGFPSPSSVPATISLPTAPGTGQAAGTGASFPIPLCGTDLVRAMVRGYFEIPGDPSGRPAASVSIPGVPLSAPSGYTPGYTLPAGRWVLPDDWPVLATFAGFNTTGSATGLPVSGASGPASVYAWDLNSGFAFNPLQESAVLCTGPTAAPTTSMINGAITSFATGPCFGADVNGTPYNTAPGLPGPNCAAGLTVGIGPFDATQACTNPFPLTFSPAGSGVVSAGTPGTAPCPATSTVCFTFGPLGPNSTYLPNGQLSQWDAPMPPAQVTFGVTSGSGFLNQVNKTGLYHLALPGGTLSGGVCSAGSVLNSAGNGCVINYYYNPFYAEAIPASPLIPPVTNNGGYLWNSWGFRGSAGLFPTTTGAFVPGESTSAAIAAGTCGPGFVFVPAGGTIPGTTTTTPTAVCATTATTFTAPECAAFGPGATFVVVTAATATAPATGVCTVPAPLGGAAGTEAGGKNSTNFETTTGACSGVTPTGGAVPPPAPGTVTVLDASGFQVGMTVEVYSNVNGATLATGMTVTAITAPPTGAGAPAAYGGTGPGTLTLTGGPAGLCVPAYTGTFIAEQFGVPFTAPAGLTAGTGVNLITGGRAATTTVAACGAVPATAACTGTVPATSLFPGTTAGAPLVYMTGAEAIAQALASCFLSRGAGPFPGATPAAPGTACEPSTVAPAGTLVQLGPTASCTAPAAAGVPAGACTGPGGEILAAPPTPYPFWQWVPNPPSATGTAPTATGCATGTVFVSVGGGTCITPPTSATVYSDNHGEAVVSLETSFPGQEVLPVNGACPFGYTPVPATGTPNNCVLPLAALGTAAFGNFQGIAAAVKAGAGTCGTFNATTGTFTPVAGATIGPNGPAAGQICVNSLGNVELGANAAVGSTTIQAIADYPYTRGEHPQISSGALTKVFTSAFNKSVTVSPGTPGPAGTTTYTVTIKALDVCGNPLSSEPIQVYALGNAGAVVLAPMGSGAVSLSTTSAVVTVAPLGATNAGTATLSLEVLNTAIGNQGLVVKVVFPLEGIERFATVISGATTGNTVTVLYSPGYQQVGGPAGSNFGVAEAAFSFGAAANSYTNVTSSAASLSSAPSACTGYWVYFAAPAAVNLPATSKPGDTASCTLAAGWNLIGNPFASPASLPSGTTAWHWNGTSYDQVGLIPTGGAVWIYNGGASSTITLTAT